MAVIAFFLLGGDDDKGDKEKVASGNTSTTTAPEEDEDTTTTTEPESGSASGRLELPDPIEGYQLYEDESGEYALTFPDDWTVGDASAVSADAMLVANAPPVDGFSTNLNVLTVPGASDGEFLFDDFGETQSGYLADIAGFENVQFEEFSFGDLDGYVITYTITQGAIRGDGYQYYAPGSDDVYILTVTVPEGADRTLADNIGTSLRVL